MEEMILNSAVQPDSMAANLNVNLNLKAEGWQAVAIVVSVCSTVVAICYLNSKH